MFESHFSKKVSEISGNLRNMMTVSRSASAGIGICAARFATGAPRRLPMLAAAWFSVALISASFSSQHRIVGADRSPGAGDAARSGRREVRSRVAAVGRKRPVCLHCRRHRPADLSGRVRRNDPTRHALALGLALGSESRRLDHREVPFHASSTPMDARSATPISPATSGLPRWPGCGPIRTGCTSGSSVFASRRPTARRQRPKI